MFSTSPTDYLRPLGLLTKPRSEFKLLITLVSAGLVENPKFDRRNLLLYGNVSVTLSLVVIALLYTFSPDGAVTQALIISCIKLFVGSHPIVFGPITWLVLRAIVPLRVRSAALSIGALSNFASKLLVTALFEVERQNLGEGLIFRSIGRYRHSYDSFHVVLCL